MEEKEEKVLRPNTCPTLQPYPNATQLVKVQTMHSEEAEAHNGFAMDRLFQGASLRPTWPQPIRPQASAKRPLLGHCSYVSLTSPSSPCQTFFVAVQLHELPNKDSKDKASSQEVRLLA